MCAFEPTQCKPRGNVLLMIIVGVHGRAEEAAEECKSRRKPRKKHLNLVSCIGMEPKMTEYPNLVWQARKRNLQIYRVVDGGCSRSVEYSCASRL